MYICTLCGYRYTDEGRHVASIAHLEAMAAQTVEEWAALSPADPIAINLARQMARLEYFYYDYDDWRRAMALPDTPDTLVIYRRLSAIWVRAIGYLPGFEGQMKLARESIRLEVEGIDYKDKEI